MVVMRDQQYPGKQGNARKLARRLEILTRRLEILSKILARRLRFLQGE